MQKPRQSSTETCQSPTPGVKFLYFVRDILVQMQLGLSLSNPKQQLLSPLGVTTIIGRVFAFPIRGSGIFGWDLGRRAGRGIFWGFHEAPSFSSINWVTGTVTFLLDLHPSVSFLTWWPWFYCLLGESDRLSKSYMEYLRNRFGRN